MFGREFVEWLLKNTQPTELLFRLAREARVVCLPVLGFGTQRVTHRGRVSLANLNESDYRQGIGRAMRRLIEEQHVKTRFNAETGKKLDKQGEMTPPARA